MALDLTKTLDLTLCEPRAFSTAMENENKESGYATKPNETTNSPPLDENACVSEEMWNGQGNAELDQTVIDKRPRKLTEKGKGYRLVQRKGERNKLKRKIQSQIANISTLRSSYYFTKKLNSDSVNSQQSESNLKISAQNIKE